MDPQDRDALARMVTAFVALVAFQIAMSRCRRCRVDVDRDRDDTESRRRWQHALTGQSLVVVSYVLPRWLCLTGLVLAAVGIAALRVGLPASYERAFGGLLRPDEVGGPGAAARYRMPGAFWFLLGAALTASCFDMPVTRYALACLSWADPAAAWVGRSVVPDGPRIHASASVAGSAACFATALAVGRIMLPPLGGGAGEAAATPGGGVDWSRVVLGASVCTTAEALPVGNDNLLIPLMTAAAVEWTR